MNWSVYNKITSPDDEKSRPNGWSPAHQRDVVLVRHETRQCIHPKIVAFYSLNYQIINIWLIIYVLKQLLTYLISLFSFFKSNLLSVYIANTSKVCWHTEDIWEVWTPHSGTSLLHIQHTAIFPACDVVQRLYNLSGGMIQFNQYFLILLRPVWCCHLLINEPWACLA